VYEDDERGYPPYHPVMLTKVLVYGYCVGVFSSRHGRRAAAPRPRITGSSCPQLGIAHGTLCRP
jgi:hypothetical protein